MSLFGSSLLSLSSSSPEDECLAWDADAVEEEEEEEEEEDDDDDDDDEDEDDDDEDEDEGEVAIRRGGLVLLMASGCIKRITSFFVKERAGILDPIPKDSDQKTFNYE